MTRPTVQERFDKFVERGEGDDCWLWTGALAGRYGVFCWGWGVDVLAHRAAWMLANGPVGDGLCVCHAVAPTIQEKRSEWRAGLAGQAAGLAGPPARALAKGACGAC
jgi:hypothetical protein